MKLYAYELICGCFLSNCFKPISEDLLIIYTQRPFGHMFLTCHCPCFAILWLDHSESIIQWLHPVPSLRDKSTEQKKST